jgi:ATP-dependent RNA helicase DHX36
VSLLTESSLHKLISCLPAMSGEESSRSFHGRGRRGGGQHRGRPPGLRGRDIGMFYAGRQREKQAETRSFVTLTPNQKHSIRQLFSNFQQNFHSKESSTKFMSDYHRHLAANATTKDPKEDEAEVVEDSWETLDSSLSMADVQQDTELDSRLESGLRAMQNSPAYLSMLKFRQKLPAFEKKTELVNFCRIKHYVGSSSNDQMGQFCFN